MIRWRASQFAEIAAPAAAASLFEQAVAARPDNALLRLKSADLRLDRYDFGAAAADLETALRLDEGLDGVRPRLARCYNALKRHREALDLLAAVDAPHYERGVALAGLGREIEAEAEMRALLATDPNHRRACRLLSKMLRRSRRTAAAPRCRRRRSERCSTLNRE